MYTIEQHERFIRIYASTMERQLNSAIKTEALAKTEINSVRAQHYQFMVECRLDWAIEAEEKMRMHICARNIALYKLRQA